MNLQEAIAQVKADIAPLIEEGYSVQEAFIILNRAQVLVASGRE